ncbi:hypothetical protein [Actinocrispum sp. NPDC049592]|uniref:hypothetical protein n=1 Tax=Actinocrispum sp. NPDC049592 TaxID=3154835 RepID=UPI003415B10A
MIPADSGGSAPGPAASQTLNVHPSSIPVARDAFYQAADEVLTLVSDLKKMKTPAWAQDPVSKQTAQQFDDGSAGAADMGQDAAIDQLTAYHAQLTASGDALHSAYVSYVGVEAANRSKARGTDFAD